MKNDETLTSEKFNEAYLIIAGIVTEHGDKYLPVFKRMHEEKLKRQADDELKAIAIAIFKT